MRYQGSGSKAVACDADLEDARALPGHPSNPVIGVDKLHPLLRGTSEGCYPDLPEIGIEALSVNGIRLSGRFAQLFEGRNAHGRLVNPFGWKWTIDVLLAGVAGVGLYFVASGRVWCRFACPLAALMHVYARFSRFAIVPDKKKCISCNVCTSVCHQGIDVMAFANRGLPMQDPQCVRCSACVSARRLSTT